jgi:polysaccharide biosynthesis/export protein
MRQHTPSLVPSKVYVRKIWLQALLLVLLAWGAPACSKTPYVWNHELPKERALPAAERATIKPGDTVSVGVVGQGTLSNQHVVAADGSITIPNLGPVKIVNQTAEQAGAALAKGLSSILASPQVSVSIVSQVIEVTVMGEVRSPGKYSVKAGDGVANALAMAGGITPFGSENAIYVVRPTEPLRIRFKMSDLVRGGNSARAFALRDGDLIVIE